MYFLKHKSLKFLLFIGLLLNLEAHLIRRRENLESENEVLEPDFEVVNADASPPERQKFITSPIVGEQKKDIVSEKDTIKDGVNFESEGNDISENENQANVIESELIIKTAIVTDKETTSAVDSSETITNNSADSENVSAFDVTDKETQPATDSSPAINVNSANLENVAIAVSTEVPETIFEHKNVTSVVDLGTENLEQTEKAGSTVFSQELLNHSTTTDYYPTSTPSLNEQVTNTQVGFDSTEGSIDGTEHFNTDKITNELIEIIKQEEADIDATFKRLIKQLRCLVLVENTNFLQVHSLSSEVITNEQKLKHLSVKAREQNYPSVADKDVNASNSPDISTSTTLRDIELRSSMESSHATNNEEAKEELLSENSSNSLVEPVSPTETKNENIPIDTEVKQKNEDISTLRSQNTEENASSTLSSSRLDPSDTNSEMGINFPSTGLYWKPLNFALFNQSHVLAGFAIFILPTNATSFANSSLPPSPPASTPPTAPTTQPRQPVRLINNILSRWNFTSNFLNRSATTVRPLNILLPFRQPIRRQQNQNIPQQQRSRQPWRGPMPGEVKNIELDMPKSNSQNDYYAQLVGVYNNFWGRLFGN